MERVLSMFISAVDNEVEAGSLSTRGEELNAKTVLALASAVVGFAASAVLGVASPANAAGGGCNTVYQYPGGPGTVAWNIKVCSANDGTTVFGDAYLNNAGPVGPTGCSVTLQILDVTDGLVKSQRTDSCYTGHHPAITAPLVSGHHYRTNLRMANFGKYLTCFSPETW
ncbi:hypothetical protein [Catellatospora methionotrophica]|uniref:hypothetical protein n=1 Tax=Catellatospora methionotrophica TaxID=121620 RepID=UPI0033C214D4